MSRFIGFLLLFVGLANADLTLVQIADSYLSRAQLACRDPEPTFATACQLVAEYASGKTAEEKNAVLCRSQGAIQDSCAATCSPVHVCTQVCQTARPFLTRIANEACATGTCSNYRLETASGDKAIAEGSTTYIDAQANMPDIVARCTPSGGAPNVIWTLEISPETTACTSRVVYNLTCIEWAVNSKGIRYCKNFPTLEGCPTSKIQGNGAEWSIKAAIIGENVRGGQARLTWSGPSGAKGSLSFKIHAVQPPLEDVAAELRRLGGDVWYAEYIGKHESGLVQIKNNCPLVSPDKGYGIYQLTIPVPTCSQIWNWKANAAEGVRRLRDFASAADAYMKEQRKAAGNKAVPEHRTGNCLFKDGTSRRIEDAVAMKRYNGATCHKTQSSNSVCNYASWSSTKKAWSFYNLNRNGLDYINEVCKKVPK